MVYADSHSLIMYEIETTDIIHIMLTVKSIYIYVKLYKLCALMANLMNKLSDNHIDFSFLGLFLIG